MNILLIEDEYHAVKYLSGLIREEIKDSNILEQLDSVEDAIDWLQKNPPPDLAFVDVQLADGLSFEIFQQVEVSFPIIFTTAYDEYTLEAFKVNSIDYLLKPVEKEELQRALEKFRRLHQGEEAIPNQQLNDLIQQMLPANDYRQRFLVKSGKDFNVVHAKDIAYFFAEEGLTFAIDQKGKRFVLDQSIQQLAKELSPNNFCCINRKIIVHIEAVKKIHSYFNHRLKLDLHPSNHPEAIVSRDRVKTFKNWVDQ